jgi:hypothetical protein
MGVDPWRTRVCCMALGARRSVCCMMLGGTVAVVETGRRGIAGREDALDLGLGGSGGGDMVTELDEERPSVEMIVDESFIGIFLGTGGGVGAIGMKLSESNDF